MCIRDSSTRVILRVYNILGKEVATLVNAEKPAGNYEVEFDASNVANGVYFYSCLLYTSPSPRDRTRSRMPSSA